jgi:lysophospholipase L1-like esterase
MNTQGLKKQVKRILGAALLVLTGCGGEKDTPLPVPVLTPGRTLTVVAMGDSLTEGNEDTPGMGGYPARLERLLNAVKPGAQVVNLGKSGWTSAQLLKRQLPTALEIKPDIALVWIGSNDLWRYYRAEQEVEDLRNYTANLDSILGTLKSNEIRTFVALGDDQSKRPVARTTEIEPYTQDDRDRMSRRAMAYNEVIAQKAREYGATTVEFFNTDIFTNPATLAADGNHPNPHGYDLIGQRWFEAIEQALKP